MARPRKVQRVTAGGSLPRPSDLYDYGIIGNLHTAALVSRFGSIDWACLPRIGSPSVFARLLDPERGGYHAVLPVERGDARQLYVPSTCLLETRFSLPRDRWLSVLDFMPIVEDRRLEEGAPMILRILEATGGSVRARVVADPRFDYGAGRPEWSTTAGGWLATRGQQSLLYRVPWPRRQMERTESVLRWEGTLEPDEPAVLEIIFGKKRPIRTDFRRLLNETGRFWREWVHGPTSPFHAIAGEWHRCVERAELTLKLLSHADTGAFVAAPTTSIPEWAGGHRNWDYRYVWVRDATFTAQALLLLGHVDEAQRFLSWVVGRVRRTPEGFGLRVLYGAHDDTDLTEKELPTLEGFLDSRPVRIGNAASGQFQLDIYGELLDAAALLAELDAQFVRKFWPRLEPLMEEVLARWTRPDHGIWEQRGPAQHFVHSKVMAWVAVDRGIRLAETLGEAGPVDRWKEAREKIRSTILRQGYDARRRTFLQRFGHPEPDAANLRIPLVGFLPFEDPRVRGTIDRVERELTDGPFVYRYRHADGIAGHQAAFLLCSFWLVECLARSGRRTRALENFEALLERASPLLLYSEMYDPRERRALGNYPQAFTHIGVLRAALALGLQAAPSTVRTVAPWMQPKGVPV